MDFLASLGLQGDSAALEAALRRVFSAPQAQANLPSTLFAGVEDVREEGARLMRNGQYEMARLKFRAGVNTLVGEGFEVPLYSLEGGGVRSTKYLEMRHVHLTALMGLCDDIAQCYLGMKKVEEALAWLEEVNVLCKNAFIQQDPAIFDWFDFNLQNQDYFINRINALSHASDVFVSLGNTGAAVHRLWTASVNMMSIPEGSPLDKAALLRMLPLQHAWERAKYRHPDPKMTAKLKVTEPALQVLGSWQKIELSKNANQITPRLAFSSFVWKGRFYVCSGQKAALGPFYRDLQYIDLNKLDTWHTLPAPPLRGNGIMVAWQMHVHEETGIAYLFSGRRALECFDLNEEKWGQIMTKWEGSDPKYWPFPRGDHSEYSMAIANGKLYVFGGTHHNVSTGCNLLIELDLGTRLWRTLSGTPGPIYPDFMTPGPRRHAAMWVDGKNERLWVLYGEADRSGAQMRNEPHGAEIGFGHDDFWSWDIAGESWRRERIAGNPPCPRSEMGSTYNTKLDKAFVFGGYCPNLPTSYPGDRGMFQFTYYGDTFMFDPSPSDGKPPKWKQVITKGFPTYRAQARMFSDPETGKIFLFGGYTNSDFVPDRKHLISRSFGDLWQLKLDVPGGFFEGVNVEEEARTAKVGPWQRCFACGNSGPWKRCSGSCGGRAFFCDSQCQRDGWKEHKEMHHCAKR